MLSYTEYLCLYSRQYSCICHNDKDPDEFVHSFVTVHSCVYVCLYYVCRQSVRADVLRAVLLFWELATTSVTGRVPSRLHRADHKARELNTACVDQTGPHTLKTTS